MPRSSTTWNKGDPSPNPGGRPKLAEGYRKAIRDNPEYQRLAEEAALGKRKMTRAQWEALKYQLDQGMGKAAQSLQVTKIDFRAGAAVVLDVLEEFPEAKARVIEALRARFQRENPDPAAPKMLNS